MPCVVAGSGVIAPGGTFEFKIADYNHNSSQKCSVDILMDMDSHPGSHPTTLSVLHAIAGKLRTWSHSHGCFSEVL
jgi:hypothetical protein